MKSSQIQEQLIVFTRYPEPGKAKTRLAQALGNQGAADLQRKLTEHTLSTVRQIEQIRPVEIKVYFAGGNLQRMQEWLGPGLSYLPQGSGNLGERLVKVCSDAFTQGCKRLVIIGSDCPDLTATHIGQAFEALHDKDLVLGPATDGGYYLIGMNRENESLFAQIPWGTETVMASTLEAGEKLGLTIKTLETLSDVDRPEDLRHINHDEFVKSLAVANRAQEYQYVTGAIPVGGVLFTRLTIIIPTRNEAGSIGRVLPELLATPGVELLVVDGGSTDSTVEVAKSLGAKVISTSPGKAKQMNAGAEAARGDILLFLHGDTKPAPGFVKQVRDTLDQPGVSAGAFQLSIDGKGFGLRVIEWLVNLRSKVLQMPYGDQGIFVTTDMFFSIGAFPAQPIMEDFELIRRLKKRGKVKILPLHATTSARRWERLGILRATAINQAIILGYLSGVSPEKLADWYGKR